VALKTRRLLGLARSLRQDVQLLSSLLPLYRWRISKEHKPAVDAGKTVLDEGVSPFCSEHQHYVDAARAMLARPRHHGFLKSRTSAGDSKIAVLSAGSNVAGGPPRVVFIVSRCLEEPACPGGCNCTGEHLLEHVTVDAVVPGPEGGTLIKALYYHKIRGELQEELGEDFWDSGESGYFHAPTADLCRIPRALGLCGEDDLDEVALKSVGAVLHGAVHLAGMGGVINSQYGGMWEELELIVVHKMNRGLEGHRDQDGRRVSGCPGDTPMAEHFMFSALRDEDGEVYHDDDEYEKERNPATDPDRWGEASRDRGGGGYGGRRCTYGSEWWQLVRSKGGPAMRGFGALDQGLVIPIEEHRRTESRVTGASAPPMSRAALEEARAFVVRALASNVAAELSSLVDVLEGPGGCLPLTHDGHPAWSASSINWSMRSVMQMCETCRTARLGGDYAGTVDDEGGDMTYPDPPALIPQGWIENTHAAIRARTHARIERMVGDDKRPREYSKTYDGFKSAKKTDEYECQECQDGEDDDDYEHDVLMGHIAPRPEVPSAATVARVLASPYDDELKYNGQEFMNEANAGFYAWELGWDEAWFYEKTHSW
jgi:hypothetical protein